MTQSVKRTERGWAGHLIVSHLCRFRRNTLLEYLDKKIVVSTVGAYYPYKNKDVVTVGCNRYYETMCFHARRELDKYWDADVGRDIYPESCCAITEKYADDKANDMHESIVDEMTARLISGDIS